MDAIFTVSETSKRLLIDKLGIKKERDYPDTERCRRALSADSRVEESMETKRRYCPNGDYILHVSNFSARKNPWTLLRAFQKLAAIPEVKPSAARDCRPWLERIR